ncbi:MAG: FAD:protein FMN transferase, partial [Pseudomonadota bacterium]
PGMAEDLLRLAPGHAQRCRGADLNHKGSTDVRLISQIAEIEFFTTDSLDEVGLDTILSSPDRIEFLGLGTALTLYGIAQGYVTDRIVDPLRRGIDRCLVDLEETCGVGARPEDRRGWQMGIKDRNATDGF